MRGTGKGFWYYRTKMLGRQTNGSMTPVVCSLPGLLQNQGGGNLGGPIKKDKLFIYGYYEFLRQRAQSSNNTTVLNPNILSALSGATPTLPFTYQPVVGGTGPSAGNPDGPPKTVDLLTMETASRGPGTPAFAIDSTMLALIKRMPTTSNNTRVGDGVNLLGYQFNARSNVTQDNYGFRGDYNLNSKNTISATYSWNRQIVDRPDIDTSFDKIPAGAKTTTQSNSCQRRGDGIQGQI